MKALFKTLFGDWRTLTVVGASLAVAWPLLHSPWAALAGYALPLCLLAGSAWLARH
ncbi:hypothetical protein [Acidihalobacter prosperus]|uniref:Uncharacterized protein n=1 Tax=Acidihalobacter prosperus TaxID=160660 RepID=A0A1A6C464_9GAMM|nr:hypothetical protein [Acidihalobacter prosperus]OBS09353.1 hypothetical protein Thpro_021681 [Acidihalobacter prosperus]